jgi:hypothetical protein
LNKKIGSVLLKLLFFSNAHTQQNTNNMLFRNLSEMIFFCKKGKQHAINYALIMATTFTVVFFVFVGVNLSALGYSLPPIRNLSDPHSFQTRLNLLNEKNEIDYEQDLASKTLGCKVVLNRLLQYGVSCQTPLKYAVFVECSVLRAAKLVESCDGDVLWQQLIEREVLLKKKKSRRPNFSKYYDIICIAKPASERIRLKSEGTYVAIAVDFLPKHHTVYPNGVHTTLKEFELQAKLNDLKRVKAQNLHNILLLQVPFFVSQNIEEEEAYIEKWLADELRRRRG